MWVPFEITKIANVLEMVNSFCFFAKPLSLKVTTSYSAQMEPLWCLRDIWFLLLYGKRMLYTSSSCTDMPNSFNIPQRRINSHKVTSFFRIDHDSLITNYWNWTWNLARRQSVGRYQKAGETGLSRAKGRGWVKFLAEEWSRSGAQATSL